MIEPVLVLANGPWLTAWIRGLLDEDGYRSVAPDANGAIPKTPFGAVLVDLALPELLGWTYLEALAADHPVAVILSGEPEAAPEALSVGARSFVHRPVDKAGLIAALRHLERAEA